MPTTKPKSTTKKTAAALAPFAPLALALLMQNAVIPGHSAEAEANGTDAAVCGDDLEGVRGCHSEYPTGCSKAAKYDAYLNLIKNQLVPPTTAPVKFLTRDDLVEIGAKTPAALTKGNHADLKEELAKLGEDRVYAVNGYFYYAQKGGTSESSNCQLGDIDAIDFHLGIGFDENLAVKFRKGASPKPTPADREQLTKTSMVVEMTPHYRLQFHPEWTLEILKPAVGYQVRVVGQLLADNEHNNTKDNCLLPKANQATCWRMGIWELHPVTQFQVCKTLAKCTNNSKDWVELEDFDPSTVQ